MAPLIITYGTLGPVCFTNMNNTLERVSTFHSMSAGISSNNPEQDETGAADGSMDGWMRLASNINDHLNVKTRKQSSSN